MAFLPLIGLAASAGGTLLGGIASGEAAGYQAQVAKNNAIAERQNAQHAANAGSAQIEQAGLKARAQGADVRAGLAANNVDVNSGSAGDIQTSQREISALDTATVGNRAAEQVYGYETQATSYEAESKLYAAQEPFDIAGGVLGAAGSILGGTSQVPGLYSWMTKGSSGGGAMGNIGDLQGGGSDTNGGAYSQFADLAG